MPDPGSLEEPGLTSATSTGAAPRIGGVLRNSSIYLLGNLASRAIGFFAIPFYSRLLTPTQFGIIDLIELSTQTVAIAFGLQSVGQVLTRLFHDQTTPEQEREVVSTGLIAAILISGIVAVLAMACAGPLARLVFSSGEQTTLLRAAFAAMFFSSVVEVMLVYERIRERAGFYLAYSLATLVLTLLLNLVFIGLVGAGVWGFVYSKLVVTVGGLLFLGWRQVREVGVRWRNRYIPEFVKFGSPLVLSAISYLAIHSSDRFFLAAAVSFADVGRYGLAYRFAFLLSILVGESFGKSWNVSLYRYVDREGWREQFGRVGAYLFYVLCLTGLALSVFGPELLRFMVLPSFFPPALILPLLVVSYVIREYADFFRNLLLIRKRSGAISMIAFGGALLNVALNLALIEPFGLYGAAFATLITWSVYLYVCWTAAAREHAIPVSRRRSAALFAGTLLAFALAYATRVQGYFGQVLLDAAWCLAFGVVAAALYFTPRERADILGGVAALASRLLFARRPPSPRGPSTGLLLLAPLGPAGTPTPAARASGFMRCLRQAGLPVHVVSALGEATGSGLRRDRGVAEWLRDRGIRALLPASENAGWLLPAEQAATTTLAEAPGTAVMSTSPPASGHLVALQLKRRLGVRWIADFQAPVGAGEPRSRRAALLSPLLERLVMEHADDVVAGTDAMASAWRRRYPDWASKIHVVWTGTDSSQVLARSSLPAGRIAITYVAAVQAQGGGAGGTGGGRFQGSGSMSLGIVAASLGRILEAGAMSPERLRLRVIGPALDRGSGSLQELARLGCLQVDSRPLTSPELSREMSEAAIVLLADPPGFQPELVLPHGFFEAVGGSLPIIAVSRAGSATCAMLARSGTRYLCIDPGWSIGQTDTMLLKFLEFAGEPSHPDQAFLRQFDVRAQSAVMLAVILASGPPLPPPAGPAQLSAPRAPPSGPARPVSLSALGSARPFPRVSVIMAVYNGAALIGLSIDSLLAQTFAEFELIVVDDCSTDATPDVLAGYRDPRLHVIRRARNGGVVAARNDGFAAARGEFVAILDHDDLSLPTRLAEQVAHLEANPGTVLVGAAGRIFQHGAIRAFDHPPQTTPALVSWLLHVRNPLIFSSVMMRRAALTRLGCFTDPDFECAEDFQLYHRLMPLGRVDRLDRRLVLYRLHMGNMTRTRQDFVTSQTARVLAGAYAALLRPDQAPLAGGYADSIARHVMAGRAATSREEIDAVGVALVDLMDAYAARQALSATDLAAVHRQTGRLWWQAVRAAVRSGRPHLAARHGAHPRLAAMFRPEPRDQLVSRFRGSILALGHRIGIRRGLREHPRAAAPASPATLTLGGVRLRPSATNEHRPPTIYLVVDLVAAPAGAAGPDALAPLLRLHGLRPVLCVPDPARFAPPARLLDGLAAGDAALCLNEAATDAAGDDRDHRLVGALARTQSAYGQRASFVRSQPGTWTLDRTAALARAGVGVELGPIAEAAASALPPLLLRTDPGGLLVVRGVDLDVGQDDLPTMLAKLDSGLRQGIRTVVLRYQAALSDPFGAPVAVGDATAAALAGQVQAICDHFLDQFGGMPGHPQDLLAPAMRPAAPAVRHDDVAGMAHVQDVAG